MAHIFHWGFVLWKESSSVPLHKVEMHSSREESVTELACTHVIHCVPISAMEPLTGGGGGPLLALGV